MRALAIAGVVALCVTGTSRAGLYSPDEPFIFDIDSEGFARPFQYAGGFEPILKEFRQPATLPKSPGENPNAVRQKYLDRVEQRRKQGARNLSVEEFAGYTADMIRLFDRVNDALNVLQPVARDPRRGGFLANAHLAVAHAYRGEWREAADQQQQALLSGFPESLLKLTPPQLKWLKRVEREYYLPLLSRRAEETRSGRSKDRKEELDVLFVTKGVPPVQFVGEDGKYAPGKIAAKEREKLPPDAIAIVQQLLLWHPYDARLYWQLGELYNAEGDVETAAVILEDCSFAMSYTNPNMMAHRQLLKEAAASISSARAVELEKARELERAEAEEKQREAEAAQQLAYEQRERDKRNRWILAIAVAVAVMLAYYQSRELIRRLRRTRKAA